MSVTWKEDYRIFKQSTFVERTRPKPVLQTLDYIFENSKKVSTVLQRHLTDIVETKENHSYRVRPRRRKTKSTGLVQIREIQSKK